MVSISLIVTPLISVELLSIENPKAVGVRPLHPTLCARTQTGEGTVVPDPHRTGPGMRALMESPVREAAVVYVNGQKVGTVWHPPYQLDVTKHLHAGANTLRIVAANLAVNEMAGAVLLARAQPGDPASLAMLAPKCRIDPVIAIERCNDDIGDIGITLRMTGFACKLDTDLTKLRWKRCVQNRFGMCARHGCLALS